MEMSFVLGNSFACKTYHQVLPSKFPFCYMLRDTRTESLKKNGLMTTKTSTVTNFNAKIFLLIDFMHGRLCLQNQKF